VWRTIKSWDNILPTSKTSSTKTTWQDDTRGKFNIIIHSLGTEDDIASKSTRTPAKFGNPQYLLRRRSRSINIGPRAVMAAATQTPRPFPGRFLIHGADFRAIFDDRNRRCDSAIESYENKRRRAQKLVEKLTRTDDAFQRHVCCPVAAECYGCRGVAWSFNEGRGLGEFFKRVALGLGQRS